MSKRTFVNIGNVAIDPSRVDGYTNIVDRGANFSPRYTFAIFLSGNTVHIDNTDVNAIREDHDELGRILNP